MKQTDGIFVRLTPLANVPGNIAKFQMVATEENLRKERHTVVSWTFKTSRISSDVIFIKNGLRNFFFSNSLNGHQSSLWNYYDV